MPYNSFYTAPYQTFSGYNVPQYQQVNPANIQPIMQPQAQQQNGYQSNPGMPQMQNGQPQGNPVQMQNVQPIQQQIQDGGFVYVQGLNEALKYPVAHGYSVTFKDETAPYLYKKTVGFSLLDVPIFEKYRLVKEDTEQSQNSDSKPIENAEPITPPVDFVKQEDFDSLLDKLNKLNDTLDFLKSENEIMREDLDSLTAKIIVKEKRGDMK